MNVPEELKYTEDHEWLRLEGEIGTVGITDYAQHELGDIVYVELPEVGQQFNKGDTLATVEAVKTVAEVYAPVGGEVVEVNKILENEADKVNQDPYGEGWMVKLKITDVSAVEELMDAAAYRQHIE